MIMYTAYLNTIIDHKIHDRLVSWEALFLETRQNHPLSIEAFNRASCRLDRVRPLIAARSFRDGGGERILVGNGYRHQRGWNRYQRRMRTQTKGGVGQCLG